MTLLTTGEGTRYRSRHLSDASTTSYQTYDTASPGSSRGGDVMPRRASADTSVDMYHHTHDDYRRLNGHHTGCVCMCVCLCAINL